MTRAQFERYCLDGQQWTPATITAVKMAQLGLLPVGDANAFEREVRRPDGMIRVVEMEPLFIHNPRALNG